MVHYLLLFHQNGIGSLGQVDGISWFGGCALIAGDTTTFTTSTTSTSTVTRVPSTITNLQLNLQRRIHYWVEHSRGQIQISLRCLNGWGRQHYNLPKFPKNPHEIKKSFVLEGDNAFGNDFVMLCFLSKGLNMEKNIIFVEILNYGLYLFIQIDNTRVNPVHSNIQITQTVCVFSQCSFKLSVSPEQIFGLLPFGARFSQYYTPWLHPPGGLSRPSLTFSDTLKGTLVKIWQNIIQFGCESE